MSFQWGLKCYSDLGSRIARGKAFHNGGSRDGKRPIIKWLSWFFHEGRVVKFHHLSVSDRQIVSLLICIYITLELCTCTYLNHVYLRSKSIHNWLTWFSSLAGEEDFKTGNKNEEINCIAWNILQNMNFVLSICSILPSILIKMNISQRIPIPLWR